MQRLSKLEAFVVCMNGQMWTKRDKNRTQNRTQKSPGVYGTFSVGSLFFFVASNPYSDIKRTVCDPGNQKVLELLAKSIYFEKYQCNKTNSPVGVKNLIRKEIP